MAAHSHKSFIRSVTPVRFPPRRRAHSKCATVARSHSRRRIGGGGSGQASCCRRRLERRTTICSLRCKSYYQLAIAVTLFDTKPKAEPSLLERPAAKLDRRRQFARHAHPEIDASGRSKSGSRQTWNCRINKRVIVTKRVPTSLDLPVPPHRPLMINIAIAEPRAGLTLSVADAERDGVSSANAGGQE